MKNPGLAAVISFFFPGIGQFYNGQFGKGVVFLVADLINLLLILALGLGFVTGLIVAVIAAWDAYRSAEAINQEAQRVK